MKTKAIKMTCLAGVLLAASAASQVATAGVSANAAATSNYVWRGLTQTGNAGAVSGGLDYEAPFGLYAGTWVSDTAFGSQELDIYGGWSTEFGPVGIDVGAIAYLYPQFHGTDDPATEDDESTVNWVEAYVGASVAAGPVDISGQVNVTQDVFGTGESAVYIEAGAETPMPGLKDTTLAVHVGSYTFDVDETDASKATFDPSKETSSLYDDYIDVSVSLAYDAWTFTVSDTTLESDATKGIAFDDDDRAKFFVTYARDWTLLK
jgi:uncharacterized protein (TIGR02001 family)